MKENQQAYVRAEKRLHEISSQKRLIEMKGTLPQSYTVN